VFVSKFDLFNKQIFVNLMIFWYWVKIALDVSFIIWRSSIAKNCKKFSFWERL